MTTESSTPQTKFFVPSVLPWVLAVGMFVVYAATMSHWMTPANIGEVVEINRWWFGAHTMAPVLFVVTLPFRLLTPDTVPLALTLFTAICAALTLAQLARSVALLPHDRTFEQRQREQSEYSLLTIRSAWMPPVFAVLACGLEMTFFENAIDATGEMFDLLIFAFVVRCLLEYRIKQKESWMIAFAFVYGLGMADSIAMVALFPTFIVAVIWIKGLQILNPAFLVRTAACGLVGMSLFFLMPLLNAKYGAANTGFWSAVHSTVAGEKRLLFGFPRDVVMVFGLTSVLPVFVIGMRWASYFGDNSPIGIFMATTMFHIIHALIFVACLWVMLDAPVSPRVMGFGFAFLPLYYLCALSIGYFSGYFLLIFGSRAGRGKTAVHPLMIAVNVLVTACVWILFLAVPLIQLGRNVPTLQAARSSRSEVEKYFNLVQQELPAQDAVVLCDDAQPFRLAFLEATLRRGGKPLKDVLINGSVLSQDPAYATFLHQRYPDYPFPAQWTNIIGGQPSARDVIRVVDRIAEKHPIYYLHPSFGYYYERFYAEPHGLVYQLKPYPPSVWNAPALTTAAIDANDAIWNDILTNVLPPLVKMIRPPADQKHLQYWDQLMTKLHLKPDSDKIAYPLAVMYSRDIDDWGVELECAGRIKEAGNNFDEAGLVNPYNVSAGINKGFNNKLMTNAPIVVWPPKDLEEKLGYHRNWVEALTVDGPIDEPNCRDALGVILGNGGNSRQSAQNFMRVKELAPDSVLARLQLAQLMIHIQMDTNGLEVLLPYDQGYAIAITNADEVLKHLPEEPTALFLKGVALMQLQFFDQAIDPFSKLITQQSTNYMARLDRAISYYQVGNLAAAKADYEVVQKALPNVYQASFGLAKIADQENDKPTALKNYEQYIATAPTNSLEAMQVYARLKDLKKGAISP